MVVEVTILESSGALKFVTVPPDIARAAQLLLYAPQRYFLIDEQTIFVPIKTLVLTRVRADGIANAVKLMAAAGSGEQSRRTPVQVKRWRGERYLVIDGNSTVTIAVAAGWPDVPCSLKAKA